MARGKADFPNDKTQVVNMGLVGGGEYDTYVQIRVPIFGWRVARAFLSRQAKLRETYAMAYHSSYYETPDDSEFDLIEEAIDNTLLGEEVECEEVSEPKGVIVYSATNQNIAVGQWNFPLFDDYFYNDAAPNPISWNGYGAFDINQAGWYHLGFDCLIGSAGYHRILMGFNVGGGEFGTKDFTHPYTNFSGARYSVSCRCHLNQGQSVYPQIYNRNVVATIQNTSKISKFYCVQA